MQYIKLLIQCKTLELLQPLIICPLESHIWNTKWFHFLKSYLVHFKRDAAIIVNNHLQIISLDFVQLCAIEGFTFSLAHKITAVAYVLFAKPYSSLTTSLKIFHCTKHIFDKIQFEKVREKLKHFNRLSAFNL